MSISLKNFGSGHPDKPGRVCVKLRICSFELYNLSLRYLKKNYASDSTHRYSTATCKRLSSRCSSQQPPPAFLPSQNARRRNRSQVSRQHGTFSLCHFCCASALASLPGRARKIARNPSRSQSYPRASKSVAIEL